MKALGPKMTFDPSCNAQLQYFPFTSCLIQPAHPPMSMKLLDYSLRDQVPSPLSQLGKVDLLVSCKHLCDYKYYTQVCSGVLGRFRRAQSPSHSIKNLL